jgi:hypothetical protein
MNDAVNLTDVDAKVTRLRKSLEQAEHDRARLAREKMAFERLHAALEALEAVECGFYLADNAHPLPQETLARNANNEAGGIIASAMHKLRPGWDRAGEAAKVHEPAQARDDELPF